MPEPWLLNIGSPCTETTGGGAGEGGGEDCGGGGGADAGEMAKAEAMIASLQKDLASKTEESRKQQAQLAEAPKSGACLVM